MEPSPAPGGEILQILFTLLIQVPYALMVYGWGKRMEPGRLAPVFFTLIPVVGYVYFAFYVYNTISYLLDKAAEKEKEGST